MDIKKITPAVCKKIRNQINEDLAALGKEYGLTIHAGNASYDANAVTFKVECALEGFDRDKEDFDQTHFLFDLPKDAYGKEFTFGGRKYTLVGLKPNRPKFPILAARDGSNYKLPERSIASLQEKS